MIEGRQQVRWPAPHACCLVAILLSACTGATCLAGEPNCMHYKSVGCDECIAAKDGRCPGTPWCNQPCMWFSEDPMSQNHGVTGRCQPANWWKPSTQKLNPGVDCFGDFPGCIHACSTAPGPDHDRWGTWLLLGAALTGLTYMVVGLVMGRGQHVHRRQCQELLGLVRDGVAVVRSGSMLAGASRRFQGTAAAARKQTAPNSSSAGEAAQDRPKARKNKQAGGKRPAKEKLSAVLLESSSRPASIGEQRAASTIESSLASSGRWIHVQ